ncbi:MAG: GNAT family N-acetyltransferase [Robiginitomaculum sp.]|nr:GNAT family N-acetyltransferase [Robiginitomaculum sp.]
MTPNPLIALGPVIETPRLILRPPAEGDFAVRAAQSADEETMQYLGGVMSEATAWRRFAGGVGHWVLHGFGFFTVVEKASAEIVGSVGTQHPLGWPGPEVGWVIGREHWRKGYGKEAATAAMDYAFTTLHWEQAVHVISPDNLGSQALAKSIGSQHLQTLDHLAGFGAVTNQIWGQSADEWAQRTG